LYKIVAHICLKFSPNAMYT